MVFIHISLKQLKTCVCASAVTRRSCNLFIIYCSASELVTEDGLSPIFLEYIEGTRLVEQ